MTELTYTRTNWQDYPEKTTPVNATNLNNIENGIEINQTNITANAAAIATNAIAITTNATAIQNLDMEKISKDEAFQGNEIIIAADQGTVKGSGVELSELATQQDVSDIYQDIANLSARGMTFAQGNFDIGIDHLNDELIGAPENSTILIDKDNENTLIELTDGSLRLTNLVEPVNNTDAATKEYVDNADFVRAIDYTDTKFTLTNTETFVMLHQHIYQVGSLVFVHLVFRTRAQIETTGLFTLGQLDSSILPQHVHSFTVVPANPGVTNDIRVDPGYIALDGTISFDITKTYSSNRYTFDITTFYCTDISTQITTE